MSTEPIFRLGDKVRLGADRTIVGLVGSTPRAYAAGWTYEVFFGGNDTRWVNEAGLERVGGDEVLHVLGRDPFLRRLLLAKLDSPLSDLFYSYQASRTHFESYQFKPVLKFLEATANGLLIADEVGLGKTIEAAIVYQELKARSNINRVLVICPAGLRVKWQSEMLSRFDESFMILDKKGVLEDLRRYADTDGRSALTGIVGLETIRMASLQTPFDESSVRYDLVIIDEAHHLRTAGRLSNAIGERMSQLADQLLLLTATPLQTHDRDLYNLLEFLDESMFDGYDDFVDQLEPNSYLNAAIRALRNPPPNMAEAAKQLRAIAGLRAGGQVTAHPNYEFVLKRLETSIATTPERVRLQRQIDQMNVLSPIYTRTRKRDVARVAKRQAHVIKVEVTEAERRFYAAVLAHARSQARAMSRTGWIPGFAGMMRERQAASCLAATREYLQAAFDNETADIQVEDANTDAAPETTLAGDPASAPPKSELAELLRSARALGDVDSKFAVFRESLSQVLRDDSKSKVLVFSYFRRTLAYLERELRAAGIPVLVIHGGIAPVDRAVTIDRFREDPELRVLLSSEVGAEGLDFQFADTLFNYDLPWNPMRVEQRIGRVDRYGQLRDKIRVYSFFLQDTIEERILERLYLRIGIFENSIGDLEPILGPLAAELTQAIFASELTEAEEIELAERTADKVAYLKEEQLDLEQRQSELLGQDALLLQAIDETVNSGRYVSGAELRAIVEGYLYELGSTASLSVDPSGSSGLLTTDARLAGSVEDSVFAAKDRRAVASEFLRRANQGSRIAITFDGDAAARTRRLEFLNLRHPLVQAAVAHFRSRPVEGPPIVDLQVPNEGADAGMRPGLYEFVLFRVSVTGAQPRTTLSPIVFGSSGDRAPDVEARILHQIQYAEDVSGLADWTQSLRAGVLECATAVASVEADQAEREARERNEAVIAVRIATLERTFKARISRRETQLEFAVDERIRRLRTGEIRNMRDELQRRLHALEATRTVGASFAPIAIGRLVIRDFVEAGSVFVNDTAGDVGTSPGNDDAAREATPERFPEPETTWRPSMRAGS